MEGMFNDKRDTLMFGVDTPITQFKIEITNNKQYLWLAQFHADQKHTDHLPGMCHDVLTSSKRPKRIQSNRFNPTLGIILDDQQSMYNIKNDFKCESFPGVPVNNYRRQYLTDPTYSKFPDIFHYYIDIELNPKTHSTAPTMLHVYFERVDHSYYQLKAVIVTCTKEEHEFAFDAFKDN